MKFWKMSAPIVGVIVCAGIAVIFTVLGSQMDNSTFKVMTPHQLESEMTSTWVQDATGNAITIQSAHCLGTEVDPSGAGIYACTVIDKQGVSYQIHAKVNANGSYQAYGTIPFISPTP